MQKDERLQKAKRSFRLPKSIVDALQERADKDPDRPGNAQYQLLIELRDSGGPLSEAARYFLENDTSWKRSSKKSEFLHPSRATRKRLRPKKKNPNGNGQ